MLLIYGGWFLTMKNKVYWILVLLSILAIILSSFTIGKQIYENREPTLLSFSTIHFLGYLFFMLMPVEILFVFFLTLDVSVFTLFFLALATAIFAEVIDFGIGYLVSEHVINKLIGKKRYQKSQRYIEKYGNFAIFFFNLFPLSSSVLSLAAGMVRYKLKPFLIYSLLGLFLKYLVLILFFSNLL